MTPSSIQLPFDKQTQQHSNWCWAATARCISHSYDSHSTVTQCNIARTQLGSNLCSDCNSVSCNKSAQLKKSLQITGNFMSEQAGAILWSRVRTEIAAGRYLGAFINWGGFGGHFVSICGVDRINSTSYLYIYDSSDEDDTDAVTLIKYTEFKNRYNNIGTWEFTFFTDKVPSAG